MVVKKKDLTFVSLELYKILVTFDAVLSLQNSGFPTGLIKNCAHGALANLISLSQRSGGIEQSQRSTSEELLLLKPLFEKALSEIDPINYPTEDFIIKCKEHLIILGIDLYQVEKEAVVV